MGSKLALKMALTDVIRDLGSLQISFFILNEETLIPIFVYSCPLPDIASNARKREEEVNHTGVKEMDLEVGSANVCFFPMPFYFILFFTNC